MSLRRVLLVACVLAALVVLAAPTSARAGFDAAEDLDDAEQQINADVEMIEVSDYSFHGHESEVIVEQSTEHEVVEAVDIHAPKPAAAKPADKPAAAAKPKSKSKSKASKEKASKKTEKASKEKAPKEKASTKKATPAAKKAAAPAKKSAAPAASSKKAVAAPKAAAKKRKSLGSVADRLSAAQTNNKYTRFLNKNRQRAAKLQKQPALKQSSFANFASNRAKIVKANEKHKRKVYKSDGPFADQSASEFKKKRLNTKSAKRRRGKKPSKSDFFANRSVLLADARKKGAAKKAASAKPKASGQPKYAKATGKKSSLLEIESVASGCPPPSVVGPSGRCEFPGANKCPPPSTLQANGKCGFGAPAAKSSPTAATAPAKNPCPFGTMGPRGCEAAPPPRREYVPPPPAVQLQGRNIYDGRKSLLPTSGGNLTGSKKAGSRMVGLAGAKAAANVALKSGKSGGAGGGGALKSGKTGGDAGRGVTKSGKTGGETGGGVTKSGKTGGETGGGVTKSGKTGGETGAGVSKSGKTGGDPAKKVNPMPWTGPTSYTTQSSYGPTSYSYNVDVPSTTTSGTTKQKRSRTAEELEAEIAAGVRQRFLNPSPLVTAKTFQAKGGAGGNIILNGGLPTGNNREETDLELSESDVTADMIIQHLIWATGEESDTIRSYIDNLQGTIAYTEKFGVLNVQGDCGSCWAHAASRAVRQANVLSNLNRGSGNSANWEPSVQQLIDCVRTEDTNGCAGGTPMDALDWWMYHHIAKMDKLLPKSEDDTYYGVPYYYPLNEGNIQGECKMNFSSGPEVQQDGRYKSILSGIKSNGWDLTVKDCTVEPCHKQAAQEIALRDRMRKIGNQSPIVYVDATNWQFYTGGIYPITDCSTTLEAGNHVVELAGVGWDKDAKLPYWLLRNSWGEEWGEEGYIRLPFGVNACGMANFVIETRVMMKEGSGIQKPAVDNSQAPVLRYDWRRDTSIAKYPYDSNKHNTPLN